DPEDQALRDGALGAAIRLSEMHSVSVASQSRLDVVVDDKRGRKMPEHEPHAHTHQGPGVFETQLHDGGAGGDSELADLDAGDDGVHPHNRVTLARESM